MAAVRDLLLGEDAAAQAEFILGLISDAAEGREVQGVISDVIQVTIAGGVGHPHVKKLAYDLCRAVPLLEADYSLLLDGIRNDVASGLPELQVMALTFMPHLPPQLLADLLEKGEVASLVLPNTRSVAHTVRAAATSCLGAILLLPDIHSALAASPALVATSDEWWDAVTDGLADTMADVILAALAATTKLFEAAEGAAHGATAMRASARRTALRVCLVMGPLIDTWRMLPSHAQVSVAALMGHIASAVVRLDPSQGEQAGAGADTAGLGGSLSAALAGVVSYLSTALQSLNPAVKMEAARVLLRMSTASRSLPPLSVVRLAGSVPPSVAASAIAALLELKERLLVEAALVEVISLVAGHLDVLPVVTRLDVLRRLWPMIALLQSPTDRMTAFAATWRTALDMHLQASEAAAKGLDSPEGMLLPVLLADPFLQDVINQRAAAPVLPGSGAGPGALLPNSDGGAPGSAPGSAGGVAPGEAAPRSSLDAGPMSPAAAGPTGVSAISSSTASLAGGASSAAAAAGLGGGVAAADSGLPTSPTGGSSASTAIQSAQQRLASGARSVGDTISGAAYSAADLVRGAGFNLPRFFDAPSGVFRGQLPASLKQELTCALLGVLAQHPSAALALQLPAGEPVDPPPLTKEGGPSPSRQRQQQQAGANGTTAQPADGSPAQGLGSPAAAASPVGGAAASASLPASPLSPPAELPLHPNAAAHGELQERAVLWLDAAVAALQATASCLQWEPLLPPPLPGQPPAPKLPAMEAVNLTTVPVDLWLQLLQGTCAASRAVLRAHGHAGLKAVYRANGGRMLAHLTAFDAGGALARKLEAASIELQAMIQRALTGWRTLALATRPRVLWVAAHYLELPALLEETWSCLLGCVEDTLLRVWRLEGDAHTRLLAASAREGLLFKRVVLPQLGAMEGKATQRLFDAAAASALVELPEYRADGLQVALCVLQYLAWVVQANAQRKDASGPAGPAEVALAKRLLDVVRAAGAAEATGVDLKEWCRRISRSLAAAAGQEAGPHPHRQTTGAGGPAFAIAPPAPQGRGGTLPGGYNAVAGFSALGFGGGGSSSDDDADDGSSGVGSSSNGSSSKAGSSDAGRKKRGEGGAGGGSGGSSEHTGSSEGSDDSGAEGGHHHHGHHHPHASGDGKAEGALSPRAARAARRAAAKERERKEIARRTLLVGNPEASSGSWGYPFTGPRARTLFISRRNRRHRLMRWHLSAALGGGSRGDASGGGGGGEAEGGVGVGGPTLASVGTTDDTGPVFSAGSGFRLDKRAFWDSLLPGSGATSGWQELTGPNDPIVLSGCYTLAGAGGAELVINLRAYNRLTLDVEDVAVAVRLVGPVRPERREVSWVLPRLLPTEAATHQFKLLPTGYGRVELHARLLLPVGGEAVVPALRCRPLAISLARLLRVPRGLVPGAHGFLEAWAGLPVSAELPVVATWPGVDGLLLALSALARQPLACAWHRALPAVCGAQAAYMSAPAAAPNESLALVVTLQLMPPPGWSGEAATQQQQHEEAGEGQDGAPAPEVEGSGASGAKAAEASAAGGSGGAKGGAAAAAGAAPSPVEAARQLCGDMRAVGHIQLRSSSHEVILAVRDHAAAWVDDLAQGTLALGLSPPNVAPSDKPLLHPSVAGLVRAFRAAPLAVPLPPQVPEPDLPPPPTFERRLKDKRDEEDSDGDDEVLPLTAEEKEHQRKELAKHEEACQKVLKKHREALGSRAAAVLQRTAIAEWRRLSGSGFA